MDRASRCIWALDCGKKDRRLFQKAMKTLDKIVRQTHDLSIFTMVRAVMEICSLRYAMNL
jgi:hypothetical protein